MVAALLAPLPVIAVANQPPKPAYDGILKFTWGGVPLAKLGLAIREDNARYAVITNVKTTGLVRVFKQHKSVTTVEGTKEQARLLPISYQTQYRSGDVDKSISLNFDPTGKVAKEVVLPDRQSSRPLVSAQQKAGSVDVLTGIMKLRREVKAALAANKASVSFPVYDGLRLFQLQAKISGKNGLLQLDDHHFKSIELVLTRKPLAGYTQKELNKLKERAEPPVYVYLTADTLYPLGLKLQVFNAPLEGWLANPCHILGCG